MRTEYGFSNGTCHQDGVGQRGTPHTGTLFAVGADAWYKIRGYVALSSVIGANDGVMQLWVDDVQVVNQTALDLYSRCSTGTHFLDHGYWEGASNSGWNETTDIYTTRFRLADTYAAADPDLGTGW
jgi:hypothetical protein